MKLYQLEIAFDNIDARACALKLALVLFPLPSYTDPADLSSASIRPPAVGTARAITARNTVIDAGSTDSPA
ncbi:hypothetical protein ACXIVK_35110 [Paraburkholderia caledonica]